MFINTDCKIFSQFLGIILCILEFVFFDRLICSDSMSRGMDIENVQCVVQYDVSTVIKRYIHRVGRTARAGKPGMAVTLLEKKEAWFNTSYKIINNIYALR